MRAGGLVLVYDALVKTAFGIFAHDLKTLVRTPLALLVALALVVLPSLCACYAIASLWNPYANSSVCKVALVNEDAGVPLSEFSAATGTDAQVLAERFGSAESLNLGSLVEQAVQDDGTFSWQVVDAASADEGLATGEYYAEFVLPESFSRDMTGVFAGTLERPSIEYWVNGKYDSAAVALTSSANQDDSSGEASSTGVVDAVAGRVLSQVVSTAFTDTLKQVSANVLKAETTTASTTRTGLDGAQSDLDNVNLLLSQATELIDGWGGTAAAAQGTLDGLKDDVPRLQNSLAKGKELLANARTSAHSVESAYASALAEGGTELASVLAKVSERITQVVTDLGAKNGEVDTALAQTKKALDETDKLIAALSKLDPESKEVADLEAQSKKLRQEVTSLEKASAAVKEATQKAGEDTATLTADFNQAIDEMRGRNDTFNSVTLPKLDTSLDSLALVMGSLDGALASLDAQTAQARTLVGQFEGLLQKTKASLETASSAANAAVDDIASARSDLAALANSSAMRKVSDLAEVSPQSYGEFMASPVKTDLQQVYSLASYGAGMAPFYTSLALMLGCLLLVVALKLRVDPAEYPGMRPWEGVVGRLLLFLLLALLQGVVMAAAELVLGVQPAGPVTFVLSTLIASLSFMCIVYALCTLFNHAGKVLATLLLLVQIPDAAGLFPSQMLPGFSQALHPWIPFTYSMSALREGLGGFYGVSLVYDLAWLFACGLLMVLLAVVLQPRVQGASYLIDRKLGYADIFADERGGLYAYGLPGAFDTEPGSEFAGESHDAPVDEQQALGADGAVDAALRADLLAYSKMFVRRYSMAKQVAPVAALLLTALLCVVPLVLGLEIEGKLLILALYLVALVVMFAICLRFEFTYGILLDDLRAAGVGGAVLYADRMADDVPSSAPEVPDEFAPIEAPAELAPIEEPVPDEESMPAEAVMPEADAASDGGDARDEAAAESSVADTAPEEGELLESGRQGEADFAAESLPDTQSADQSLEDPLLFVDLFAEDAVSYPDIEPIGPLDDASAESSADAQGTAARDAEGSADA